MRIAVLGLGYVGAVSAACLASDGHHVIGVDPNQTKVDLINAGQTPIIEADVGHLISAEVKVGRLVATTQAGEAVLSSDISLICVGTPSQLNGNLDLSYVRRVCEQIGEALQYSNSYHVVAARSTMLPGSMRGVVIPTLETASNKVAGVDFGLERHEGLDNERLALMKPTATLTNIARGGIVDEAALAAALRERRIAAAGLDVFEGEPAVHPDLLAVPNVVLTPHIASATVATRRAMAELAADNLLAALAGGTPPTPINAEGLQRRG